MKRSVKIKASKSRTEVNKLNETTISIENTLLTITTFESSKAIAPVKTKKKL